MGIKAVLINKAGLERDWLRLLFPRLIWEYEQMGKKKYFQVKIAICRVIKESSHD